MRPVGTLNDGALARRFGDYLVTLGIANRVDPSREGWTVWIVDENDVERAKGEYGPFTANPSDPRYDRASDAERIRRDEAREDEERTRRITSPRQEWTGQTQSLAGGLSRMPLRASPVTLVLIGACIGVALATMAGEKDNGGLMTALYIAPVRFVDSRVLWDGLSAIHSGEVWRLVSPILLHFGIFHILFNMWWLRDFGMMIEPAKGSLKFTGLVLVTAVVSNLAQYAWGGPYFGGMSGVLYGLFGYIWMRHRFAPWEGLTVSKSTVVVLVVWLFLCMTGWMGPIGNASHVSGLVTGMAIGYAPVLRLRFRRKA